MTKQLTLNDTPAEKMYATLAPETGGVLFQHVNLANNGMLSMFLSIEQLREVVNAYKESTSTTNAKDSTEENTKQEEKEAGETA